MCLFIISLAYLLPYIPLIFALPSPSTKGIEELLHRRLPSHVNDFSFGLVNISVATTNSSFTNTSAEENDHYVVSNGANGTIRIEGNSPIALATGLRWYLWNVTHVDIWWFIGSRLQFAPTKLPTLNQTYFGKSIVPWRYHFNTVTFSYTAFPWTWEDWELQLDWMALRGINLALAWVGYEKILMEVFLDAGFTEAEVISLLSGPAFQSWNRFGNIQGSWGGELQMSWINSQFELQKKIVARMVELGMTPVLPCFTGFVPRAIDRVYPDANFVNGSAWEAFPSGYTNVTFLEPTDSHFTDLQISFIAKQVEAYGNVTNIYTLDQFNENDPASGDLDYLQSLTRGTWQSLKAADPNSIWMMQGWLFYSNSAFWTDARIEAWFSGVPVDSDMLVLDLFSESQPQWQRTNSYYGKPWIWCQLHGYGGNMGLYGQVENVTLNPISALANSSSMVGMGNTMEGQEGNEIMYDLLLDQAWSSAPLNTTLYFTSWVTSRYSGSGDIPASVYEAWDILLTTVYNNTNLTASTAVTKSIFELSPNSTGLVNRTGHHATTLTYQPKDLVHVWNLFYNATAETPSLWSNDAFTFDLVDMTRQVLANAFEPIYISFLEYANSTTNTTHSATKANATSTKMVSLLSDLDNVLLASDMPSFALSTWIAEARAWAYPATATNSSGFNSSQVAQNVAYYEYNARNQITLWGPTGQVNDYSSRQWGGLISSYYIPRWQMFIDSLLPSSTERTASNGANPEFAEQLLAFEEDWGSQTWGERVGKSYAASQSGDLVSVLAEVIQKWPDVFGG